MKHFNYPQTRHKQAIQSQLHGQKAEDLAVLLLLKSGYQIVLRNFYSAWGEIDIIALEQSPILTAPLTAFVQTTLIFCEVKYRKNVLYGGAVESVSKTKQHKLIKTALYFLEQNEKFNDYHMRFDVICFNGLSSLNINALDKTNYDNASDIVWLKNAIDTTHLDI